MYIRLCNLKNHRLFILVKRHNFSTWAFPEPGSWAVTDLGAFSALVLLCWPTSLWITNNRICYSEAETIPTQTTQGICLQINMAFVFYCFLQVLVSWVIHAVQPFCLPECTCSEESFGHQKVYDRKKNLTDTGSIPRTNIEYLEPGEYSYGKEELRYI